MAISPSPPQDADSGDSVSAELIVSLAQPSSKPGSQLLKLWTTANLLPGEKTNTRPGPLGDTGSQTREPFFFFQRQKEQNFGECARLIVVERQTLHLERTLMLAHLRPRLRTYRSTPLLRALLLAMTLLLVVGMTACSPANSTGSAPTPTPHTQHCGSVQIVAGNRVLDATATQVEYCFWQAFIHCQPAVLIVNTMGIDTSNTHTFTIKQNGATCTLIDQSQNFAPPNHKGTLNTYTCAGLVQQDGLLFKACQDDGDFAVPAPTPA